MVEVEVAQQPEGFVLVRLAGEIDMSQAAPVRHAFTQALGAGGAAVLIDLCDLRFLAVAGVDWVDAAVGELTDQGRAVAVVCTAAGLGLADRDAAGAGPAVARAPRHDPGGRESGGG